MLNAASLDAQLEEFRRDEVRMVAALQQMESPCFLSSLFPSASDSMYSHDEDGFPSASFLDKESTSGICSDAENSYDVVDLSASSVTPFTPRSGYTSQTKDCQLVDTAINNFVKPESVLLKTSLADSNSKSTNLTSNQYGKRPRGDADRSLSPLTSEGSYNSPTSFSVRNLSCTIQNKHMPRETCTESRSTTSSFVDSDRALKIAMSSEVTRARRRAAISRFRLKKANRKLGHKKLIRYQSRQKIAEVRPRVNGRFCKTAL